MTYILPYYMRITARRIYYHIILLCYLHITIPHMEYHITYILSCYKYISILPMHYHSLFYIVMLPTYNHGACILQIDYMYITTLIIYYHIVYIPPFPIYCLCTAPLFIYCHITYILPHYPHIIIRLGTMYIPW